LILAAALAFAACGGGSKTPAGSPAAEEKVLNVYNWTDYIGRNTIADFEARTGIKVVYDTYDSNEIVETKMLTGASGYDIVVPTATFLERLIKTGAFLKLDKSSLPNLANMDPEIMRRLAANDPGNLYSIDYTWGMDGLAYNPQMVRKALGTDRLDSWSALFVPAIASRLASCGIAILDAPEDAFNVALIYLGRDPNSEKREDLDAAEALWKKVRPYIRYFHCVAAHERPGDRRNLPGPRLEWPRHPGACARRSRNAARRSRLRHANGGHGELVRHDRDSGRRAPSAECARLHQFPDGPAGHRGDSRATSAMRMATGPHWPSCRRRSGTTRRSIRRRTCSRSCIPLSRTPRTIAAVSTARGRASRRASRLRVAGGSWRAQDRTRKTSPGRTRARSRTYASTS
jgi:hypothetical protein